MRRVFGSLIVLATLALEASPPPAPLILWKSSPETVDIMVHDVPPTNAERLARLRKYFEAVECRDKDLEVRPIARSEQPNLICVMPGATAEMIVVAAHYDTEVKGAAAGGGSGAVDDWSGAVMLPMLFKALHATVPQHTYIFAEFAGNKGAQSFLRGLNKQERKQILSMVGLDALGVGAARFWASSNEGQPMLAQEEVLATILRNSAETVRVAIPEFGSTWSSLKVDDTQEFRHARIPSILIHSLAWENHKIVSPDQDRSEAIKGKEYYETYKLLSTYCAQLDRTLDERLGWPEKGTPWKGFQQDSPNGPGPMHRP